MKTVLPYRTLDTDPQIEAWLMRTVDGIKPLPAALLDWDYGTVLELRRTVNVDIEALHRETGLDIKADLGVVATWQASSSQLRGSGQPVQLDRGGSGRVVVELVLPGEDLGGTLGITTSVVLLRSLETQDLADATAHRAGSVLWRHRDTVRLQGDAPLFPVAIVDMAQTGHDVRSPWALQLPPAPDAPVMGSLLLLVNDKRDAVVAALAAAANPKPEHRLILSALKADVGRTLIEHALSLDDFDPTSEYDDETLGAVLAALVGRCFPGKSIEDLRLLRSEDPSRWASSLGGHLGLFDPILMT